MCCIQAWPSVLTLCSIPSSLLLNYSLRKEAHKLNLVGMNTALVVQLESDIRHAKLPDIVTKIV